MKYLRRFLGIVIIVTLLGGLFRGSIYRGLITYHSLGIREGFVLTDSDLKTKLDDFSTEKLEVKNIIEFAHQITAQTLAFSFEKQESNPNRLVKTQKANCIGYAQLFASICNYMLKKNDLDKEWSAQIHIGKLEFLGNDMHRYFQSSFFKDHDFVIVQNVKTQEIYAVDPTVYDYFKITTVRLKRQ